MSPPSKSGLPICAICAKPIGDRESFQVGTVGQKYHLECVRQRREEGNAPEVAEDPENEP